MPGITNDLNITQLGIQSFNSANGAFTGVTITGGTGITVTNGNGQSGNPTISLSAGPPGAIEHLTGDTGGQLNPDVNNNFNLKGQQAGVIPVMDTIGVSNTISFEDRTWTTPFVVDPSAVLGLRGTFTTITLAMASAVAGNAIFVRPGTYTENFTWTAGVDIVAYDTEALTPSVTIIGKITCTDAGARSMSGIRLQTNSDFVLAVTGTLNTVVTLSNCFLNLTNNTGISYTTSGASSLINLFYCRGNITTTGITLYAGSGAGGMVFEYCKFANTGAATTASTMSSTGQYFMKFCYFENVFSNSGTGAGFQVFDTVFNTGALNTTVLSLASTAAGGASIDNTFIDGGTASAVTIGTGSTVILRNVTIKSSNTNAITEGGASTLQYSELLYAGTSSKINVTTQTLVLSSCFQKIVVQTFTTGTTTYTVTPGMKWCVVELQGCGGGGGATTASGATAGSCGGGGGAGAYCRKVFSAVTIGNSQSVVIGAVGLAGAVSGGAGGTGTASTFGALLTANGGGGGTGTGAGATSQTAAGGAGGTSSSGDFNATGSAGATGFSFATAAGVSFGGIGGASYFGSGGQGATGNGAGNAGQSFGGGGGGASTIANGGAAAGGAGGAGICIVTEYL